MKNIFIFSILLLVSCTSLKQTNVSTNQEASNQEKNKYLKATIKEFKIVFFMDCMSESFDDNRVDYHLGNDGSYTHDFGLGLYNYRKIDTLVHSVVEEIRRDSIEWTNQFCKGCSEEEVEHLNKQGMSGKRTLKFCLDYYTSEELDSIARLSILEQK